MANKFELDQQIEMINNIHEDMVYKAKKAKAPRQKRNGQEMADLFGALLDSLRELKGIKHDANEAV